MATYVISDLHGQYDIFAKLLEKIQFSADDFMYVIGDVIDRGPDGIKIIQKIMSAPNMDLLIGNHEFMMLFSVSSNGDVEDLHGRDASLWLFSNGGDETFRAYCGLDISQRKSILEWLNSRMLSKLVVVGGRTFCLTHSYYREDLIGKTVEECSYREIWDVVWPTPYRSDLFVPVSDYIPKDRTYVIGHVPVQRVHKTPTSFKAWREENIILIDGGCSLHGRGVLPEDSYGVICLKLEDLSETEVSFS